MQDDVNPFLAIIAFAIGFPFFWMAVTFAVAQLSGWASLARRFPASRPPTGQSFEWVSGKISRLSNYNRSLNVTVSSEGVHIVPNFIFKFGHKPIFLQWKDVSVLHRGRFLFSSYTDVGLPGGSPGAVRLFGERLADALEHAAPVRLKADADDEDAIEGD